MGCVHVLTAWLVYNFVSLRPLVIPLKYPRSPRSRVLDSTSLKAMVGYQGLQRILGIFVTTGLFGGVVEATPLLHPRAAPTVTLDSGTFTGSSSGGISKFLGIPFGQTTSVSIFTSCDPPFA